MTEDVKRFIEENIETIDMFDYKSICYNTELKLNWKLREETISILKKVGWFNSFYSTGKEHIDKLIRSLQNQATAMDVNIEIVGIDSVPTIDDYQGWNVYFTWRIDIKSPAFDHPVGARWYKKSEKYSYNGYTMNIPCTRITKAYTDDLVLRRPLHLKRYVNQIQRDIQLVVSRSMERPK